MAKNSGIHTLCWKCANTNGDLCSWFSADAKPVEGWEAIESPHRVKNNGKYSIITSYIVLSCPNFEPMRKEVCTV